MWGGQIDFEFSLDHIAHLAYCRWEMFGVIFNAGMSHEFQDWWARNKFPRFTNLVEPILGRDERSKDDDDGGDDEDGGSSGRRIHQR